MVHGGNHRVVAGGDERPATIPSETETETETETATVTVRGTDSGSGADVGADGDAGTMGEGEWEERLTPQPPVATFPVPEEGR